MLTRPTNSDYSFPFSFFFDHEVFTCSAEPNSITLTETMLIKITTYKSKNKKKSDTCM